MHWQLGNLPSLLDLGSHTNELIVPSFEFFKNDNVAPGLASSILIFAVFVCAVFLLQTVYIAFQVGRRTRAIKHLKTKSAFTDALPRIEKLMLSSGYLRHSWEKFRETLVEPIADDEAIGDNIVRNTERPQNYFNMSEAGLRFPLYRAMPNLLVGVGLLLTFVGLVTALYFTTEALDQAQDLEASQNALKNLLHAASFKFYTSVAGLGGSILLTIALRIGVSRIEASFDRLASALESKILLITPESIAYDHYREAKEQTKNLKLFNTEVAISVGRYVEQAITATLPKMLEQTIAPIGQSLSDVANTLNRKSESAVGDMAQSFVDRLQGATGEQMQRLADTLGDLRLSIDQINVRMNESGSGLAENVARSTRDLNEAIAKMAASLDEMTQKTSRQIEGGNTELGNKLAGAVNSLDAVSAKMTALLEQGAEKIIASSVRAGSDINELIAQAAQRLVEASERSASQIGDAVGGVAAQIAAQASGIGKEVLATTNEATSESRAQIVSAGKELARDFASMGGELEAAFEKLRSDIERAAERFEEVERSIASHSTAFGVLSRATVDAGDALSVTARSLKEVGEPISESVRAITVASKSIADATTHTESSIQLAQGEIRHVATLLRETLESTRATWEAYESRFKGLDENLGLVLENIIRSVQANLDSLGTFVERVDEKLAGAVDRLGGGIEDLGEFAQSIEKLTDRIEARPVS